MLPCNELNVSDPSELQRTWHIAVAHTIYTDVYMCVSVSVCDRYIYIYTHIFIYIYTHIHCILSTCILYSYMCISLHIYTDLYTSVIYTNITCMSTSKSVQVDLLVLVINWSDDMVWLICFIPSSTSIYLLAIMSFLASICIVMDTRQGTAPIRPRHASSVSLD